MERQQTRHHHQPKLCKSDIKEHRGLPLRTNDTTTNPKPCKGDITTSTIRLQTKLFAPYRGVGGWGYNLAVGASPHPILLYPYGVEPQQIKLCKSDIE